MVHMSGNHYAIIGLNYAFKGKKHNATLRPAFTSSATQNIMGTSFQEGNVSK